VPHKTGMALTWQPRAGSRGAKRSSRGNPCAGRPFAHINISRPRSRCPYAPTTRPYVGTWALDIANCQTPQDSQDAPLVIAKDRYDQHEVHCTFRSVDAKESDYKIAGDCTVEGNAQSYDFTLTVSGDTLTFTDEAGARDFLRCK
jgi:hypothetical protein